MADGYCERPDRIDPEFLVGLFGNYEIVGREPDSGITYSGELEIQNSKNGYALKRIVSGETAIGKAWVEFCSPDKFPVLKFKYEKMKQPLEGSCFLRMDGDNYYLISCRTEYGKSKRGGLESMFQRQN